MDTRTKIISIDEAAALARDRNVRRVAGYFDPLLVEHVRRMRELATAEQVLIAVIVDPPEPLLPLRARAELVAALADVDYVVMQNGPAPDSQANDGPIRDEFIQHVVERHQGVNV